MSEDKREEEEPSLEDMLKDEETRIVGADGNDLPADEADPEDKKSAGELDGKKERKGKGDAPAAPPRPYSIVNSDIEADEISVIFLETMLVKDRWIPYFWWTHRILSVLLAIAALFVVRAVAAYADEWSSTVWTIFGLFALLYAIGWASYWLRALADATPQAVSELYLTQPGSQLVRSLRYLRRCHNAEAGTPEKVWADRYVQDFKKAWGHDPLLFLPVRIVRGMQPRGDVEAAPAAPTVTQRASAFVDMFWGIVGIAVAIFVIAFLIKIWTGDITRAEIENAIRVDDQSAVQRAADRELGYPRRVLPAERESPDLFAPPGGQVSNSTMPAGPMVEEPPSPRRN